MNIASLVVLLAYLLKEYLEPQQLKLLVGVIHHETDGFKSLVEYNPKQEYGDYYGRGLLHLTWKANYKSTLALVNQYLGAQMSLDEYKVKLQTDEEVILLSALAFLYLSNIERKKDDKLIRAIKGRDTTFTVNDALKHFKLAEPKLKTAQEGR